MVVQGNFLKASAVLLEANEGVMKRGAIARCPRLYLSGDYAST